MRTSPEINFNFLLDFFFIAYLLSFVTASIVQNPNGMQTPLNVIKIENPGYYCSSYTPPVSDHTAMMPPSTAYSEFISLFLRF